jgi:hypothetical protein
MKSFDDLNHTEKDLLLKFPVYVSMLAAEKNDHLDKIEKRTAIQFCHIKTFTCDPLLSLFYHEAEKISKQISMNSIVRFPAIRPNEKK